MSDVVKGPATAQSIADHVGVSASTVSIVLRGDAERRKISKATTERVLDAARKFNYVPNHLARNLRRQRSNSIGVLTGNLEWGWADRVMQAMEDVLEPAGYRTFVARHRFDPDRACEELLSCMSRRDLGIVFQPLPTERPVYDQVLRARIPLVFLSDYPNDAHDVSFVGWDSGPAARRVVEHLVEIGRRRIAFLGPAYPMAMNERRYSAYLEVLREADLPIEPRWAEQAPLNWSATEIVERTLDRLFNTDQEWPDAIFALNDGLALPALASLERRGIRVPEDVALAGLGDLPVSGYRGVGLTTVCEPLAEIGQGVASVLLAHLVDPNRGPLRRLIPSNKLIARRTTVGDAAAREAWTARY